MDQMTYAAVFFDVRHLGEGCLDRTEVKEEYKTGYKPVHKIIIVFSSQVSYKNCDFGNIVLHPGWLPEIIVCYS